MTISELKARTDMNRKQFAEYFGIPYRTVEDWEKGKREPAEYLIKLMEYKLLKENKIDCKIRI